MRRDQELRLPRLQNLTLQRDVPELRIQVVQRDDFGRIDNELNEARHAYRKAQDQAWRYDEMLKSLAPGHPDGTQAARLANQQLRQAWDRYQTALKAFAEYNRKR